MCRELSSRRFMFTNGKIKAVSCSPILHLSLFTNVHHQPMSDRTLFRFCIIVCAMRPNPPFDCSPVRCRFVNRRRLCTKFCPGWTTYDAWCSFLAIDKTSASHRLDVQLANHCSRPSHVLTLPSCHSCHPCHPCPPNARVSTLLSTSLS